MRDEQEGNLPEIRRQLISLSCNKKCRISAFSRERPVDWRPTQVRSPLSGLPFTEAGAWAFIAERLEAGHPIQAIMLDQPPGSTGYVMEIHLEVDRPALYVKLELGGSGKVFGRSFHYSER
jgi:hypothetical protein